jgi:hypothetical protein
LFSSLFSIAYDAIIIIMSEPTSVITFPTPVLTPVVGKPTNTSLKLLQRELNANAMSVSSNRGGGIHGHLSLTISPAEFQALTNNVVFVIPVYPGNAPFHPPGATNAQITETNRQYKADLDEYRVFNNTEQALKRQLLTAVDRLYLNELQHETLGFANSTTLALLTHLHSTYGIITFDQLEANLINLERQWDPSDPIEHLWAQVTECRRFAEAGLDPISEITAVRKTLLNIEHTGVFSDAIRDWRKRPDAEWTWVNFKHDFALADRERQRQLTSESAGYHGAHAAIQAATDAATIAAATATAAAATALAAVTAPPPPAPTRASREYYYCWTHGLGLNRAHTSATCSAPAEGHRREAIMGNMLGGNNTMLRRRGETSVYRSTPRTT